MRWSLVAAIAPALAGCSLIYNPNNLPDPRMIDAAVVDSDPSMPVLTDVWPTFIDEGQGDFASAPALLVLRGNNLVNLNLQVTLTPANGATVVLAPVTDALASSRFDYVAFTVTAHVDQDLLADVDVPLDITVTQDLPGGGTATSQPLSGKLSLRGHAELQATAATTLTTPLASTYSMVALADVTLDGSMPAVIHSISSITTGAIMASADHENAGPGGYEGLGTSGGGPGGGGAGTAAQVAGTGGGGGGAGFSKDGTAGQTPGGVGGSTGGAAGRIAGNDLIVPMDGNLPSAGGSGGAGSLAGGAPGGVGGGGGGVVVLLAGGDITTGDISANGGAGRDGAIGLGNGGGGGGGAGGAVIVSSASGTLTTGQIHVANAAGGAPGGGASSVGRVRWDAGHGSAPSSPDRAPHRGPAFMASPRVFTKLPQRFTLVGTRGDGFSIRVTDQDHVVHDAGRASFGADDTAMIMPALYPGHNQVCITLDGGAQGHLEADQCIAVAYLP